MFGVISALFVYYVGVGLIATWLHRNVAEITVYAYSRHTVYNRRVLHKIHVMMSNSKEFYTQSISAQINDKNLKVVLVTLVGIYVQI